MRIRITFVTLATVALLAAACSSPEQTATPGATATSKTGNWRLSRSVDPITDRLTVFATLNATTGINFVGEPYTLNLRCRQSNEPSSKGDLDVWINWKTFINNSELHSVTHRLNGDDAKTLWWTLSATGTSTFWKYEYEFDRGEIFAEEFLARLNAVETLTARVTPFREAPITGVFELSGIAGVADEVLSACGV